MYLAKHRDSWKELSRCYFPGEWLPNLPGYLFEIRDYDCFSKSSEAELMQ